MAAARARITELEAREAEHERSELVQRALYRVAETASTGQDMPSFYSSIHEIVSELMYAANFYIALYDAKQQAINFPYYVDEVDVEIPDPALWQPFGVGNASGLTAYTLRTGRVTHITRDEWIALVASGEIATVGVEGEEWLGVPLRSESETIGVLVVQTYESGQAFTERDVDVLTFVGQHVAQALTRARAIDETRQRNEELALVNEIGSALASKLDFDAIIDLVGERIRGIFRSDSLGITLFDPETQLLTFPYTIDHGDRVHNDSWKLGPGLTSEVITTRRSLRLNTSEELAAHAPVLIPRFEGDTEFSESWLGVPILAGGRVLGVVSLEHPEPHAFTAADERLLSTLASSMGVALENARLFEETKRLLAETDERAAELAIINSVQQGLAENLDMQTMYDLVGDKIREIFDAQVVDIGIIDQAAGVVRYPYTIERGQRFPDEPTEIGKSPLMVELLKERQPILLNDMPAWEREHGMVPIIQGERSLSVTAAAHSTLIVGADV